MAEMLAPPNTREGLLRCMRFEKLLHASSEILALWPWYLVCRTRALGLLRTRPLWGGDGTPVMSREEALDYVKA